MDPTRRDPTASRYIANIEQSLSELQSKINEYHQELAKLQQDGSATNQALLDSKRAPFQVMASAFTSTSENGPFMPSASSVLPALLALRNTHRTITESRDYAVTQASTIQTAERQLEEERANLDDQRLLTTSLENRINSLKDELDNRMDLDPEQAARARLDETRQKKKRYDLETARLTKDLHSFIDEHLAAQLAAEELGGPVVGDNLRIDAEDIAAGFNAQGRAKKTSAKLDDDKRQRRLEEVWGPAFADRAADEIPDEITAAGLELRDLTEELLNKLSQADGDSASAYVKLSKETAAARFLVRSKVAQLHPRDATRIRMIDFGKELDD